MESLADINHLQLKLLSIGSQPLVIPNVAYNADGLVEYVGSAIQGTADDAAGWRIEKRTYDTEKRYIKSRYSKPNQVWDNRASVTYT